MKNFLKYTLATITGIILASLLFFVVAIASLSAMIASGEKPVSVEDNSILVMKAGVEIPDRGTQNPLEGIDLFNMTFTSAPGLNEILHNIEKASADSKIKGILIENGLLSSGWATTGEIRDALDKFRKEGKFVIAYSDYVLTQQCYYLSSAADKIYIQPGSIVDFKGLSGEVMFYRKALEKIGVEVQVIRHGKFKGAVEPFILDKLSEENKAQIKEYVGSIWKNVVTAVSLSRNIPEDTLNLLADNLAGNIDVRALSSRMVDGLIYRDQLIDTLKLLSGISSDKDLNLVSMAKYTKVPDPNRTVSSKNRISVIYASGTIVTGKGNENNIGGNYYADIIRKERLDTSVKAIVLRVNSPGGNAIASDIMWRELELAAKAKPLIVSMGNYAASGGYFISAPATRIFADPSTISGSIGVFGLLPNAGILMEQKLGLTTEIVNTNKNSDSPSITRAMSSYEKEIMQLSIENTYTDFVGKVAEGRKMSPASVDSIGQGRVWCGINALKIGLVDTIGGLKAAIGGAAKLAGIEKWSLRELPVAEDPYTRILNQLSGELKMNVLKNELGESVKFYDILNEIKDLKGIQARLPYLMEIR
jgi:protease IV